MNVCVYMEGFYGDLLGFGLRENKANSKPNKAKAGLRPETRSTKLEILNELKGCV